jgi:hypothetical protein
MTKNSEVTRIGILRFLLVTLIVSLTDGARNTLFGRDLRPSSVVSHAMLYNMIRVCHAAWHVDEPRGIGDHA